MDHRANIFKAIARSREARRGQKKRRRRAMIAACASAAVSVPFYFSLVGVSGNDLVHAAVRGATSLSDLLDARSPGERTAAQLTKTKHARPPARNPISAAAPPDRVPPITAKRDFGDIAQLLIAPPPPIDLAPPLEQALIDAPTLSGLVGAGPGTVDGPPGGGGGSASFPASEPRQPVTPVSAVPEPGTWATMLLGFGLLGWRLRRRRKSTEKTSIA